MADGKKFISEIGIENFKGFEKLKLEGLAHFNLCVGGNNIGKTSVLEALVLTAGMYPKEDFSNFLIDTQKTMPKSKEDLKGFFHNFNTSLPIKVSLQVQDKLIFSSLQYETDWGPERVECTLESPDNKQSWFVKFNNVRELSRNNLPQMKYYQYDLTIEFIADSGPITDPQDYQKYWRKYNNIIAQQPKLWHIPTIHQISKDVVQMLEDRDKQKIFLGFVQKIDPRIDGITIGDNVVKFYYQGIKLPFPLHDMGTGFIKVVQLYTYVLLKEDMDVLLFDEITDGLHPDTIQILIKYIVPELVERNIQLFATTHSYDILREIAKYEGKTPEAFSVYRMFRQEEQICVRHLGVKQVAEFISLAEIR